jgi:hypothetical protein
MSYAKLAGKTCTTVRVVVGNVGPWFAECEVESDVAISGQVTLEISGQKFVGTVDANRSGTYGNDRKVRLVAGGGGWSRLLAAKNYHNDTRIKAKTVAEDAAREAGETLGDFVPAEERIGVDYVREAGLASRVLEDVVGGVPWWVGYDGVTRVGTRATSKVAEKSYEVLAYDPVMRRVTLGVTDVAEVLIGSIVSKQLEAPQTIRELEIHLDAGELRINAWCGGSTAGAGHLAGLMRSIVERSTDDRIWGKYRYRVVRMNGDRVELQAVRKAVGLPDVMPVSMWPGVAGAHAELTPGAEVIVEFVEGDRTMPVVTHFAGKDGVGHVPVSLTLCGSTQAAARQGDLVQSGGVGTVVTLTPMTPPGTLLPGPLAPCVGLGMPYFISFSAEPPTAILADPLYGAISTGSPKVKA